MSAALFRYFKKILLETNFPVWLSLLMLILSGLATYFLSPSLNEKFEKNRVRSEFLLEKLENYHSDSGTLVLQIQKLMRLLKQKDSEEASKLQNDIKEEITRLNWNAYEFDVILDSKTSGKILESYLYDLNFLRTAITDDIVSLEIQYIDCRNRNYILSSYRLLKELGQEADLSFETQNERSIPQKASCSKSQNNIIEK